MTFPHCPVSMGQKEAPPLLLKGNKTMSNLLPPLYDELLDAGCNIGNYQSDLHVEATTLAREIIRRRVDAGCIASRNAVLFRSDDPRDKGALFFDCPFAFSPWYERYRRKPE